MNYEKAIEYYTKHHTEALQELTEELKHVTTSSKRSPVGLLDKSSNVIIYHYVLSLLKFEAKRDVDIYKRIVTYTASLNYLNIALRQMIHDTLLDAVELFSE
jgi:hypothetical protein